MENKNGEALGTKWREKKFEVCVGRSTSIIERMTFQQIFKKCDRLA